MPFLRDGIAENLDELGSWMKTREGRKFASDSPATTPAPRRRLPNLYPPWSKSTY